jgi:hypothetical protein
MSAIANLSSVPPALSPLNVHAHGHKRGSHAQVIDDSSSGTAAKASAGTTQNLFGRLLHSLEKVIGAQLDTATSAAASASATANTAAAAGSAAVSRLSGANISVKA